MKTSKKTPIKTATRANHSRPFPNEEQLELSLAELPLRYKKCSGDERTEIIIGAAKNVDGAQDDVRDNLRVLSEQCGMIKLEGNWRHVVIGRKPGRGSGERKPKSFTDYCRFLEKKTGFTAHYFQDSARRWVRLLNITGDVRGAGKLFIDLYNAMPVGSVVVIDAITPYLIKATDAVKLAKEADGDMSWLREYLRQNYRPVNANMVEKQDERLKKLFERRDATFSLRLKAATDKKIFESAIEEFAGTVGVEYNTLRRVSVEDMARIVCAGLSVAMKSR